MTRKTHQRNAGATGPMRSQHLFPRLSPSLYKLAAAESANGTTPIAKPEKPRGHPRVLLTDEQVREFRTLLERDGWSVKELARKFDVTYQYALNLSKYQTRSRIFPDL